MYADGSYCEHGREIFDEEAETSAKDKKGKAKKPVSSWLLVRLGAFPGGSRGARGKLILPPPQCTYHTQVWYYFIIAPTKRILLVPILIQGMPKRVAKPTSNIKHMLLNAGSSSKKKKQVCMIRVRRGREGGRGVVTWLCLIWSIIIILLLLYVSQEKVSLERDELLNDLLHIS